MYNEVPEIIKIYNLNGALLYNFENNTNNRISLDKLRSGIYILHLEKDVIVNRKIYIN
ncbi:MAG: T9SS type A sorting domain-containing protein [Bacteroidales bacterium]|nr:T9SS type A sorting domain-containing protein [Bacteroidales bacterium]